MVDTLFDGWKQPQEGLLKNKKKVLITHNKCFT